MGSIFQWKIARRSSHFSRLFEFCKSSELRLRSPDMPRLASSGQASALLFCVGNKNSVGQGSSACKGEVLSVT
jgi:hypothetical protein